MRRIDVLKKVLIGGKASKIPIMPLLSQVKTRRRHTRYYQKNFTAGGTGVSPSLINTYFGVRGGYLY